MAQKKTEKETKSSAKAKPETQGKWKKPKITRHGNMRQLTQMSA
ncbi:MAG TPA: hypothetical protein VEF04_19930 [Blastocatellia bacterium]|nr:hypothetical protein [Blastocatellia bacterium]